MTRPHDERDLVIEILAEDLDAMTEHAVNVEVDRERYRELAHVAIAELARLTTANRRLQARVRELIAGVSERDYEAVA
jgi:hypothetical protein